MKACFALTLALAAGVAAAVEPAEPAASAASAAAQRGTVVVTGSGRRIAQAELQLRSPGEEPVVAVSDERGEASLALAGPTKVKIRVIAAGFATYHGELTLKPGQSSEIQLAAGTP